MKFTDEEIMQSYPPTKEQFLNAFRDIEKLEKLKNTLVSLLDFESVHLVDFPQYGIDENHAIDYRIKSYLQQTLDSIITEEPSSLTDCEGKKWTVNH